MSKESLTNLKKYAINQSFYVPITVKDTEFGVTFESVGDPVTLAKLSADSIPVTYEMVKAIDTAMHDTLFKQLAFGKDISSLCADGEAFIYCEYWAYRSLVNRVEEKEKFIKSSRDFFENTKEMIEDEIRHYDNEIVNYIRSELQDKIIPYAKVKFLFCRYGYSGYDLDSLGKQLHEWDNIESCKIEGIINTDTFTREIEMLGYVEAPKEYTDRLSVSNPVEYLVEQYLKKEPSYISLGVDIPLKKDLKESPSTLS